jgi:hypothetical protein
MTVDHLISISDPRTVAAIQVVPEDVIRVFGETHKTIFTAHRAMSKKDKGKRSRRGARGPRLCAISTSLSWYFETSVIPETPGAVEAFTVR